MIKSLRELKLYKGKLKVHVNLSKSNSFVCNQLMCENVGKCCVCKLSMGLEEKKRMLESLDLSYNGLTILPPSLWELENVKWLNVAGNGFKSISKDIVQLAKLETIVLGENEQLEELPIDVMLMDMPMLENIILEKKSPWYTKLGEKAKMY